MAALSLTASVMAFWQVHLYLLRLLQVAHHASSLSGQSKNFPLDLTDTLQSQSGLIGVEGPRSSFQVKNEQAFAAASEHSAAAAMIIVCGIQSQLLEAAQMLQWLQVTSVLELYIQLCQVQEAANDCNAAIIYW